LTETLEANAEVDEKSVKSIHDLRVDEESDKIIRFDALKVIGMTGCH